MDPSLGVKSTKIFIAKPYVLASLYFFTSQRLRIWACVLVGLSEETARYGSGGVILVKPSLYLASWPLRCSLVHGGDETRRSELTQLHDVAYSETISEA